MYTDRSEQIIQGIVATGLIGVISVGIWGFSPAQDTRVIARYGNWETQFYLQEEYESCYPVTISTGNNNSFTTIQCSDSWKTIDQVYSSGHCMSRQVCDDVTWPTIPDHWLTQAESDDDIKITSRGRFTIAFEDPELNKGNVIMKDYTEEEYRSRMPIDIDLWFNSRRNRFGMYSKP